LPSQSNTKSDHAPRNWFILFTILDTKRVVAMYVRYLKTVDGVTPRDTMTRWSDIHLQVKESDVIRQNFFV